MGLFDSLPPPSASKTAQPGDFKRRADNASNEAADHTDAKRLKREDSTPQELPLQGVQVHLTCVPLSAAFSEDKGSRLTMEDVAVIKLDAALQAASAASPADATAVGSKSVAGASSDAARGGVRLSFFAIADGHGGANVARYVAEHLHTAAMEAGLAEEARRLSEAAAAAAAAAGDKGSAQAAACPQPSLKQCRAAIAEGFKELDRKVLERCAADGWPDGCTAVAVWVLGDTVLVAHVGDARCVLARRPAAPTGGINGETPAAPAPGGSNGAAAAGAGSGEGAPAAAAEAGQEAGQLGAEGQTLAAAQQIQQGQAQQAQQQAQQQVQQPARQQQQLETLKAVTLTREHKPVFPGERQRIEKAGSFVSADGRLAGRIEVSRAFGDRQFKRSGMSVLPDIQAFQLGPREAFLLLACDGFWGVFSPQDAVDFAQREMALKGRDPKQTCNRLLHEAIRERRCKDNCTVMLVKIG
ncbi:hypothetical protein ABPG77_003561 [Micractinium sp. CCAP 211/92]